MDIHENVNDTLCCDDAFFTLTACDQKGPAEKAGENIDDFNQEMQHEADEAGDEMEEQYKEMQEE